MQGSHQEVSRQSSCLLPPQYGGEHIWNRACEAAREGVKATGQYFVLRFTNDKTEDQRREQRLSQGSRAKKHQSKKPGYSGCCGQTKACNLCHRLRGRENTQEGMERRTKLNEECLPGALREAEDCGGSTERSRGLWKARSRRPVGPSELDRPLHLVGFPTGLAQSSRGYPEVCLCCGSEL